MQKFSYGESIPQTMKLPLKQRNPSPKTMKILRVLKVKVWAIQ
jgi:hypothetical protein